MTPWARQKLGRVDRAALDARAAELGVTYGAGFSARHREWTVSVAPLAEPDRRVTLRGKGPLAVVIAGALDDFEQQQAAA